MARHRILDTNVLINHWRRFDSKGLKRTAGEMKAHAEELIEIQGTNLIVSPVLIEFLAGATSSDELKLYLAFLQPFKNFDNGDIPPRDWKQSERFAKWVKDGRRRKLGDCLIKAIAERLNCDVITGDPDFKSRILP